MTLNPPPGRDWAPRAAVGRDAPAIEALIPASVRGLQWGYYTAAQIEAALGGVFAVDRQLITDGSYFVVEDGGAIIGCGGWSRRRALCGGDGGRRAADPELDPASEPARLRAFFVHPSHARRGVARSIVIASEAAIRARGFGSVVAMATLAGEPLYLAMGYREIERCDFPMDGGLVLPVVRMGKALGPVDPA